MDASDPSQPPQSPRASSDAIAAAHHGAVAPPSAASASISVTKRRGGVLFDTPAAPNKRATPPSSTTATGSALTPSHRAASSTPASSAAARTPASVSSTTSNRSDCINNSFFKWARLLFIESRLLDATDDAIFSSFKARFSNKLNFRFKQENQTAAVVRASIDSQPRTRQEARSSSTMKTNLKLKSVEGRMEDKKEYGPDNILSTLRQCTMDRTTMNTRGMNEEDREVIDLEQDLELDEPVDEDAMLLEDNTIELEELEMDVTDVESSTAKGYNVNCLCDIWSKGKDLLMQDDIKNSRNNEHDRYEREKKMMEAIGEYIRNATESRQDTKLMSEDEDRSDTEAVTIAKELSSFG